MKAEADEAATKPPKVRQAAQWGHAESIAINGFHRGVADRHPDVIASVRGILRACANGEEAEPVPQLQTMSSDSPCPVRNVRARVLCLVLVGSGLLATGCSSDPAAAVDIPEGPPVTAVEHAADVAEWETRRRETLNEPDGWLSLVGLMWLDEGENSFGSDQARDLVYTASETPPAVGVFVVSGETVSFEPAADLEINTVDGERVAGSVVMQAPRIEGEEADPFPILTWGPLRWHVIRRKGQFAVRLKDALSPILADFDRIEMFPVERSWRLDARFEPYDEPKTIMIPNILGTVGESESPGAVVFVVDGEIYRLDTWKDSDDPDNFFTAFGDLTNRHSTYGGGRFLWIDAPDENGYTFVDFNRAYNPPCVFTPYATCPLPPEQNRLPLAIEAGEKIFKPRS